MRAEEDAGAAVNLDRLAEQVDELVRGVEQHSLDAEQIAREIEQLLASVATRQQRMARLEAAVVEWRRRLTGCEEEEAGAEERSRAEERLAKLQSALITTRVLMQETERKVNQLTGQQQQQRW